MATTSAFGWETPDDTDLVKDGAAAIRTLGNSIDTSMSELKGGTTGQILSKTSATDMDFTWTTPNPGDITAVTAGTGITGGGTSGDVTVSFDQANFGGGQFAAGKNKIINGNQANWQRGTSITLPNNTVTYAQDRFYYYSTHSAGTATVTQQTFTPGAAPVAGYEGQFFARMTCGSTTTYGQFGQRIEDVRTFANNVVTLSYWAKASVATTLNNNLTQNFGTGGSGSVTGAGSVAASVTTSWQRFSTTITLASITGKTIGTGSFLEAVFSFTPTASQTLDIWGVQVEAGSVATPFQTASGGSPQAELAMCQRYYFRSTPNAFQMYAGGGVPASTSIVDTSFPLPVQMRVYPTSLDNSQIAVNDGLTISTGGTTTIIGGGNLSRPVVRYTHTSGTLVLYRPYFLADNGNTGFIGFSAEL
jgi:hypothetical protein